MSMQLITILNTSCCFWYPVYLSGVEIMADPMFVARRSNNQVTLNISDVSKCHILSIVGRPPEIYLPFQWSSIWDSDDSNFFPLLFITVFECSFIVLSLTLPVSNVCWQFLYHNIVQVTFTFSICNVNLHQQKSYFTNLCLL